MLFDQPVFIYEMSMVFVNDRFHRNRDYKNKVCDQDLLPVMNWKKSSLNYIPPVQLLLMCSLVQILNHRFSTTLIFKSDIIRYKVYFKIYNFLKGSLNCTLRATGFPTLYPPVVLVEPAI